MAPRRKNKFVEDLAKEFPEFRKTDDQHKAFCEICEISVNISNKGKSDLKQHLNSEKHKQNARSVNYSKKLTNFVIRQDPTSLKVYAAEATLAFHVVSHNLSYMSTDCSSKLFQHVFPDSEIANRIASARTKTEAIVNNVIAPHSLILLKKHLEDDDVHYVGVSTDGSNFKNLKTFPVLAQFFDPNNGIEVRLLAFEELKDETSETITDLVFKTIKNFSLEDKCKSFAGDNTNSNFGGINRTSQNNVFSRLKTQLKCNLIGIGCPAHILHNAAKHGLDTLSWGVESLVLAVFNYFSIYAVRTANLKSFCEFTEVKYRKILKHCGTRWLSLLPCIDRLLQMWPALKSYFLSLDNPPAVIKKLFEDDDNETYFWFVHSFMSIFHAKIEAIEREKNDILEVIQIIKSVQKNLEDRIEEKFLPLKVKEMLRKMHNDLKSKKMQQEFINVYEVSAKYLKRWTEQFEILDTCSWMRLEKIPKWPEVEETLEFLKKYCVEVDENKLFDQFVNLRSFMKSMEEESSFPELMPAEKWVKFFNGTHKSLTTQFVKICSFVFSIPAHNANCERIFSMAGNIWTDKRNRLETASIKNILMVKFNIKQMSCQQFYEHCLQDKDLLAKIGTSEKYDF